MYIHTVLNTLNSRNDATPDLCICMLATYIGGAGRGRVGEMSQGAGAFRSPPPFSLYQ